MLSKLSYLLLVFLFAAFTQADFIQPLTRTPLRPFSVNQNYTTDYSFSAYIPSSITDQATIEVEFPLPYSIPSACQVALQIPSNSTYGTYSCTKTTASKYVIDVGQIVAGEYQFVFQNIENPSAYPASSNFKIRTYYNQEILVDSNEYFDSVPFLPTPVISYGASVQNLGYSQVNLGSKFDFTFTLTKSITKGDSMKINFPVGFYFVKPACFHRNSGSYTSAEVLYNNRMLICQSFQYDIPANKSQIVSILGLVNPGHAGFFLGSYLETMEGLTPNIIEKILVNNPIEIDPGSVTVEIISSSVLLAINTTHQLNLLFDDDVPSTAQVWIKIPSGFSYLATNCTLLRPLQAAANSEVTCGLAANNTGYIINGFSIISASQQVSVLISVQNPAVVATYTIPVYSYSTIYQAKIDEGSGTITLNDTYGSSRYFAAHALQWTEKLKYNQTGPIEFTFFLNIPLPATTSTFQGKIEVDIKPQIPYPPVGTLRCFFNNTVPGECTWNTSLADRTILTIFTPATEGYFQSEVPITVTTETDVGNFGIKLPELIQRYKFYFYFYRNGETMFHEVYYEDWVPDPIVMPSTWYTATFAPLQYGQESYLNIAWTNNYLNLSTNYFFELEFDHSNLAWDFNLGWPATQWYETLDMPCIGEGLGPNVRCVLKPGGAQYTTSYIQMIGLSEITYGVTYNLHFPKIKFGTSGKGTMLFTLYENTPGESTLKIPIVTATLSFTPNAAQTYSTGTFTTLSLTPNQPDYNSTLAMAFTSSANPAYTIYSYPANFSLQTGLVSCGGSNLCYAFDGDNVNWLVFKPSPTQGTATSTTLTILTAPYVGSYRFTAKTTSGGSPVQNYIATNYTLNPAGLTVTLTADASNPQINSNSILLFDVKFTTVTHLPANASVQIVFTQLTVPQGDSFYCQVVSGLVEADARGVACTRISATTIRLNNINETVAGTAVSLIFQLKTNTQTTVTAVASTYYYFNAIDLVDRGTGSATLTYKYTNFLNATLFNDRSGELVRVGTTGIFNFNITSTGTYTTATVAVTFDAGFDVTATTDVLLCRINNVRRRCTYTRNPLVVTITGLAASTFTATTLNTISISSDFETSYTQGIVAPTTPGWHPVNFAILVGGTIQEQIADYIYIYPSLIPLLSVSAVPATASQLALYTFSITLSTALNSNLNSGVRGRMFIDFPTGSDGFAVDLGTGLSTGEYVGCNVEGLTTLTNIHCRLIASLGNGSPASVEIIGFDAITAATAFTIRIGGIKNPSLTAGEYVFAFRTDQYTTATGVATPLEYTRYALWNLVTALTAAVPSYLAPDSASFQSQAAAGQSSTDLTIDLYAGRALAVGDYYVYALPTEVVPSMTLTCPARVSNCWGFPDNGWVVYQLGTALPAATVEVGDIQTVTIPARLSTQGYTFTAYAWKSDQLDHTIDFTINNATYTTLTGNIVNKKLTVVADQLVTNRVNTECFVEFTPSAAIPNTGTIQITFPTGFTVHANCKSALSAGSGLTSTTGMVACAVQGTSWIVTNFDNVAASTPIKIYGLIDLPSTAGTYNPSVKTYANQDADIANNGQPIETATTGFGLTISTMNTLSLDVGPTSLVNERIQAATASYHPLVFDFTVTQATAATTIQLRVDGSTTGFSSTRTTGEPYICYFEQANTSAITACTVTTTTASSILTFSLTPKQTLSVNTDYRCVITTAFAANGNDGVVFPTAANVYKAAVVVTTGTAQQTDITFFELVPSEFASLIVKSYVIAMSQENVIDISLTTPTGKTITATQRLVVELPTTFNGTNMFDEDVGQGLLDNAAKPCDVISSVPTGVTMSCFFQKGNRIAGTPASVVVYGFSAAFSNLRFAFTVNNPAITTSTVIPLTIYTMLGTNAFTKTYYQHVENAVLVRDTAATVNANQQTAPTYSVQTLSTKATLTINVYLPNAMTTSDYYVISTPQMSSSGKASVNTLTAGFGTAQAIVLPQCQFIIVSSTAGQAAAGTYSLAIPNVYNPDVVLTTAQNTFSAMLSSFVNLATTNITYAAGTITTTLSTTPTVTLSNLNTQRESIMTITINTAFKGIRSVIIVLGTRVTVEDECYEGPSSAILIQQCATVPASNQIIVTLENAVYSTAASSLVVRLPVRNGATAGAVDGISYYFYSTVATSYTVTTGQVSVLTSVTPGITLTTVAPSAVAPTLAEFVYTPYSENRQGIVTGAYGDLLVTATLTAAVTAGQEVQITLDNFNIAVTTTNTGDVSGSCAAIITNGGNNYLIAATIQNQNVVSITLPTGTTLAAGATTFRITQMGAAGDQVGVTAQTTTTDQLQVTMNINDDTGNLVANEASATVSSFLTRNLNPTRAPIRLRFEVAGAVSQVVITLPANSYNYDTTSNGVCYFRAYSTILDYVETQAQTCTITGTLAAGFTITATSAAALTTNTLYELVVETDSATSPYFNTLATANQQAVVGFYNTALTLIAATNIDLYQYQATPLVSVTDFYYVTGYSGDPDTLIFQTTVNTAIPAYPTTLIELELTSASSALLQSGMVSGTVSLECGILGPTKRTASVDNLRCSIVPTSPPRVRIENYQAITAGTSVYFILYDLDNSVVAADFVSSFSSNLIVTNTNTFIQSQHRLTRMFVTETGSVASAAQVLTFPTSSATTYGTATTLTKAITWGTGESCDPCRFIVRGIDTDYDFPATNFAFLINTDTETTLVDTVNNIFVVLSAVSPMTAGTQYTFSFGGTNMLTPQSYQRNSGTIQIDLYGDHQSLAIYNLTGSYPTLTAATVSTTTAITCTTFASAVPGTNGNVDCVVRVPLGSGSTNITGVVVDLPNTNGLQYSEVYNYCNAYVSAGSATALKSMLTCSRQDPTTTNARFFITGFQYVAGSTISFTLRARAVQSTSITATVQLQATDSTTGSTYTVGQTTSALSIASAFSTSYAAPTAFSVSQTYEAKVAASSTSPLRAIMNFGANLNVGGSVTMTLGSGFALATGIPLCTIRDVTTYDAPYLTKCAYASNVYTLTLIDAIPSGRYLVEVTSLQKDMATEGVTFPTNTKRTSLTVQVNSAAATTLSVDLTYVAAAPGIFPAFSIAPQRNKIPLFNSQFNVNIQVSTLVDPDTTSEENLIVISFSTSEYDADLGASTTTFSADNIPYYNGMAFAGYFSGLGTSAVSSLHYGYNTEPALVIVSGHSGLTANTATIVGLDYIKNPAANKGMSAKISILNFASGQYYPTVLYEAQYTNFFNTITAITETAPALTVSASSMTPYVSMTLTLSGKNYGTDVDTTSIIYIKLKNEAEGFDYTAMTGLTCTGYSVQWYKEDYTFYLTPLTDLGTQTPTIVCTGFVLSTNTNDIEIETGIYKEGYGQTAASYNTLPIGTQSTTLTDTIQVTRVSNLANVESVNLYQITYNPQTFTLAAGTYFVIQIPSGLQVIPGRTEYITYTALTDNTATAEAVHATLVNGNIMVSGYAAYSSVTDGVMTLQFFLRNIAAGNQQFRLTFYEANGNQIIQSSLSQAVTVSTTPNPVVTGTFGPYLTDTLDVYGTEQYPFKFMVQIANTMSATTNGKFVVTLPTGFTLTSGQQICKYSSDNGTHWIWSTSCTVAGSTVTIPLQTGFDLQANAVVYMILTTISSNFSVAGIVRPNNPVINTFQITSQQGTTVLESVYLPLVVYPPPLNVTAVWYTRGAGQDTVVSLTFSVATALTTSDYIQLEFIANDEIIQVFPNDLGTGSTENRILGNCGRDPSSTAISANALLDCYIIPGVGSTNPSTNVNAKVVTQIDNAIAASTTLRYLIAGIQNPTTAIPGGFVFTVMRPCRNDGYGCPLFRRRNYANIIRAVSPTAIAMSVPTLQAGDTNLFVVGVETTLTLGLSTNVATTDAIVIKTDLPNMALQSPCTSPTGTCINFPALGWTFFQPSAQLTSGTKSFSVVLDNGLFYDRTNTLQWRAETWISGSVNQVFTSDHPNYNVMVPTLLTNMTQADPAIQEIVTNFVNILQLSMTSIWRTDMVRRIIVNIPSSYAPIDNYCMAGVNLDDISNPNYTLFACNKTGDRQVLIVIDDEWEPTDASLNVVLYYRGLLRVNATTGTSTASTITSYASLDPTEVWVVDENTGYQFYVSPIPTPIIRDLNLNLKSFNDRKAQILDYVEFYGAIWPYTQFDPSNNETLITQILFEIDDEFSYPTMSTLVCYIKVIFRQYCNCTLSRTSGKTLVLMEMPPDYENGPFLFTITNTQENLLFQAPDHEGNFAFNITMENQYGDTVEQASTTVSISGEEISNFSAQPILIDPLVQTLYEIDFTTEARVTPQGFMEEGQTVSTEIVLEFQTFDPAFPIDLGTGLADGSAIACIPVQGITITKTGELTCTLVYGTTTDPTQIIITNYDAIPALTSVIIYIDGISTLGLNETSRINLEVYSTYSGSSAQYEFYYSEQVSPTAPTASIAKSPAALQISHGGSNGLQETSNYNFTFTTTTALTANQDWIIIEFPEYGYEQNADYSSVLITIVTPSATSSGYVMPIRNIIYLQPKLAIAAGQVIVSIADLPNPSFVLTGATTFTVETVVNRKIVDVFTNTYTYSSETCSLFSNEKITYSSAYALVNENTYQISFTVDHDVPADGSLAVIFDSSLYNLKPSNPTCQLVSGFSSAATCDFELFSQQLVRVNLNGVAITSGTQVQLNILNVNNPTSSTASPVITIQSYFDDSFGTTKTICSVDVTLPAFNAVSLVSCPIDIEPEINNVNQVTAYLINIYCSTSIRNATTIDIQFPTAFQNSFSTDLSCTTNGNYMLQDCSLIARTTRVTVLISQPNVQAALVVRVRNVQNPSLPGTYGPFSVTLSQYDVQYGLLDSTRSSASVTIVSDRDVVTNSNALALSIFPKNYGEKAVYYFNLIGLEPNKVPSEVLIQFDKDFAQDIGPSIECGTFTPQQQYGDSYALNYEDLQNHNMLDCSVIDNQLIQMQLTPIINMVAGQAQDIFFFISNVINPSLTQDASSTSYSFNFTFTLDQAAVIISQNTVSIDFELPPSLLEISSVSTTETNILSPANYNLTFKAIQNLPISIDSEANDYELLIGFQASQYPTLMQDTLSYSFPNNTALLADSSAFAYNNAVYIRADYPDFAVSGPFIVSFNNMTNPDVESQCGAGAQGLPVKFGSQYVNREEGYVFGRTYNIMDQGNCLTLNKNRSAITVVAPLYLRQGLVYTLQLQVEEPAADLSITPIANFLTFTPTTVTFSDYTTSVMEVKVQVSKYVPVGDYTIQWRKTETSNVIRYLEIEDTNVIVVSESTPATVSPLPNIDVESIRYIWTGKMPREVTITLSQEPADEITLEVNTKVVDSNLQASLDGVTFSNFPISITFGSGDLEQMFFIYADVGAKDNVLTYTLTGENANVFDPNIPNSPFIIRNRQGINTFQILSIQSLLTNENSADYLVSLSDIGTVYYLAVIKNAITPTLLDLIQGELDNVDTQYYQAGSVEIEKVQGGTSLSSYINFTSLAAQTNYQIYFVARSVYGEYTAMQMTEIQTRKISDGANVWIPTFAEVDPDDLIEALSIILPIAQSRLYFAEAETYPQDPSDGDDPVIGSQLDQYRIIIAPDQYENDPTPMEIAQSLLTSNKQTQLLALVPQFYMQSSLRITPVKRPSPEFIINPSVGSIGYYNIQINVELISIGKLYAIVTARSGVGDMVPTSYQIANGLAADNTQVSSDFYQMVFTNDNGNGQLVFTELKDYTEYNVYVTAGSDVPYEPAELLDDSSVYQMTITTLKNPNLGSFAEANALYDIYYDSLLQNYGYRISTVFVSLLVVMTAMLWF